MTNEMIEKILNAHYVPYYIADGNIWADEMLAYSDPSYVNVSGYSKKELYDWLGY